MRQVVCIDKLKEMVCIYNSVSECSRMVNYNVSNVLQQKCAGPGRYIFLFKDDYELQYPNGYNFK